MFKTILDPKLLVWIKASSLSLDDEFMQHIPTTKGEERLKDWLKSVISKKIKDFCRPVIDPGWNYRGKLIYITGLRPMLGKSYSWWANNAEKAFSDWGGKARLGTKDEYIAFCGVLIKKLVSNGWSVDDAWDAVCNDSSKLGNYKSSEGARIALKDTGSNEVCGFFDLANTYKILAGDEDDDNGFFMASGCYMCLGNQFPIADIHPVVGRTEQWHIAVGWIVLETS